MISSDKNKMLIRKLNAYKKADKILYLRVFCLIDQTFRKVLFSLLNYELSTEWTIVPGELKILARYAE